MYKALPHNSALALLRARTRRVREDRVRRRPACPRCNWGHFLREYSRPDLLLGLDPCWGKLDLRVVSAHPLVLRHREPRICSRRAELRARAPCACPRACPSAAEADRIRITDVTCFGDGTGPQPGNNTKDEQRLNACEQRIPSPTKTETVLN